MSNFYDTDRAVVEYLIAHYAPDDVVLPYEFGPKSALQFQARVVSECVDRAALPANARALDLGCAVGRTSFELSQYCGEVLGIDASQRLIASANAMKTGGFTIQYPISGALQQLLDLTLPSVVKTERVRFMCADAMALDPALEKFDVVIMANLIDRLPNPTLCLSQMKQFLTANGQLIVTSPYTWMEDYTPKENWLNGLDGIRTVLEPHFDFVARKDLPFLIREHARKFQWSVAEASIWRRKNI